MYVCLSCSPALPLKEKFSLYQKLWDLLDQREEVDKRDTKEVFLKNCCEMYKKWLARHVLNKKIDFRVDAEKSNFEMFYSTVSNT